MLIMDKLKECIPPLPCEMLENVPKRLFEFYFEILYLYDIMFIIFVFKEEYIWERH